MRPGGDSLLPTFLGRDKTNCFLRQPSRDRHGFDVSCKPELIRLVQQPLDCLLLQKREHHTVSHVVSMGSQISLDSVEVGCCGTKG